MSEPTWERLKEIFEAALERPEAERAAFLAGACGDDSALRAEVEALLAARANAGGFLGATADTTRDDLGAVEPAGTVIGRYKLLQRIGEGGFGTVFMAEQEHPVRRKVALKIIKLGMDTRQVIARFEAERQALALMDHPNIARVLDAGSTETGRPYFVMELVRGVPITEYCDQNNLSMRERLDLFQKVCSAVQHAHQKGIIHRDIKPSNVMVTLHDGTPVPKVIDFGIAKATNQRLTEKTLFTEYRQFIGTPQYMSPEQAEMSGLDVDTRADIYSLGVLLYELLTGTTPFDPKRLRSLAVSEIHRVIREEDPHKPSTRVSTLGASATDTAKHRRTDLRELRRALSGDLDWIVMKALEKDRTRRYDTANALLQDIRRHLRNEPVVAGPPGAAYRMGKFLRRNRTAVAVTGAVAAALLVGLGAATYGFWQASRERAVAREAAESAESVSAFFGDMLASINPQQLHLLSPFGQAKVGADVTAQFSHDVSVAEMLERAARRVDIAFGGKPELEASVRETIGTTLLGLGECDDAVAQFERAEKLRRELFGLDDREVLRTRVQVASALYFARRGIAADSAFAAVLADLERREGPEDPLAMFTASAWARALADQGRPAVSDSLLELTLERQRRILGSDHRDTIVTLGNWAGAYCWRGMGEEAEKLAREAHDRARKAYSPDDAVVLLAENRLALALTFLSRKAEAKEIQVPSLDKCRRVYGDDHEETRACTFVLARACIEPEEIEERIALYRRAIGDNRSKWVRSRDLGWTLVRSGRVDEALDVLRGQYEFWRDPESEGSRRLLGGRLATVQRGSYSWYSRVLAYAGRWNEVRRLARQEIERLRSVAESGSTGEAAWNELAWTLLTVEPADLRDPREALACADSALARLEDGRDVRLALYLDTKARAQAMLGHPRAAAELQRRCVEAFLRAADAGREVDEDLAYSRAIGIRYGLDDAPSIEAAVRPALDALEARHVGDPAAHAAALRRLGGQLSELGLRHAAVVPLRLALERSREGGNERERLRCLVAQARFLARSGRREEADPLLTEARSLYRKCWVKEPIDWHPGLGFLPGRDGERSEEGNQVKVDLCDALLAAGHVDEAEDLYTQTLAVTGHGDGRLTAPIREARGDWAGAERRRRVTVIEDRRRGLSESQPYALARDESDWARSLMQLGRWDEAEPLLQHARRVLRDWGGETSADYRIADERLRKVQSMRVSAASR